MSKNMAMIYCNEKFFMIKSYLNSGLSMVNPEQGFIYLPLNVDVSILGNLTKEKIRDYKEIDWELFLEIMNAQKLNIKNKDSEEYIKIHFGYKSSMSIYKKMKSLMIELDEDKFILTAMHKYKASNYEPIEDEEGKILSFEYPKDISDERLGNAIKKAFKFCTL